MFVFNDSSARLAGDSQICQNKPLECVFLLRISLSFSPREFTRACAVSVSTCQGESVGKAGGLSLLNASISQWAAGLLGDGRTQIIDFREQNGHPFPPYCCAFICFTEDGRVSNSSHLYLNVN